jgi:thiol-disulfide isomerase/thioredoxin
MKRKILLSGLIVLLTFAAGASAENATAPNWTLYTPAGEPVELAKVSKNKPQIILFWATWCPYCKALMPHLQSVLLEYGDEVGILAVNIKEDGDPVSRFEDAGFDFTLLLDGDAVADEYDIIGVPGVIIVDTRRQIRFDLRKLPGLEKSPAGEKLSHGQAAKRLAPYWAAEIRKALDGLSASQ